MEAYSAFHNYSIGNQILALVQCQLHGLEPGPINTFPGWQALGRSVNCGERALFLCMPITCKRHDEGANENNDEASGEHTYTAFVYKPRWFVVSQTIGEELTPPALSEWDAKCALAELEIERIAFTETDGNCQGYARKKQIAINPVAQLSHRTQRDRTSALASRWAKRSSHQAHKRRLKFLVNSHSVLAEACGSRLGRIIRRRRGGE